MSDFRTDPPIAIDVKDARELIAGAEDLARRKRQHERSAPLLRMRRFGRRNLAAFAAGGLTFIWLILPRDSALGLGALAAAVVVGRIAVDQFRRKRRS